MSQRPAFQRVQQKPASCQAEEVRHEFLHHEFLPEEVRYVFLLRHGQSRWNEAKRECNIPGLLKEYDHGLTSLGRDQAMTLRMVLRQAKSDLKFSYPRPTEPMKTWLEKLTDPDMVYTSPFTRAIETAIIALEDILEHHRGKLKVSKKVREVRTSMGSMDSIGSFTGEQLKSHVQRDLESVMLNNNFGTRAWLERALNRLDLTDVQNKWWADAPESGQEIALRLRSCIDELEASRTGSSAIVVGHSEFFRQLLRTYISDSNVPADISACVKTDVIENCGILGLKLHQGRIVDVMPMQLGLTLPSAGVPTSLPTLLGSVGEIESASKAQEARIATSSRSVVQTQDAPLPTLLGSFNKSARKVQEPQIVTGPSVAKTPEVSLPRDRGSVVQEAWFAPSSIVAKTQEVLWPTPPGTIDESKSVRQLQEPRTAKSSDVAKTQEASLSEKMSDKMWNSYVNPVAQDAGMNDVLKASHGSNPFATLAGAHSTESLRNCYSCFVGRRSK